MVEHGLCQYLGGGIKVFESDDSFSVDSFEVGVLRIIGIHAEGMIVLLQKVTDEPLDYLKVADHLVGIEGVCDKHAFHLPGVTVGKTTLVGML